MIEFEFIRRTDLATFQWSCDIEYSDLAVPEPEPYHEGRIVAILHLGAQDYNMCEKHWKELLDTALTLNEKVNDEE